uniref:DnaJ homolog subfamily C member 3 n=1 Tax=Canis lupus familiaris TaxID=9615 RepID=A0A8C0RJV9_CANLF
MDELRCAQRARSIIPTGSPRAAAVGHSPQSAALPRLLWLPGFCLSESSRLAPWPGPGPGPAFPGFRAIVLGLGSLRCVCLLGELRRPAGSRAAASVEAGLGLAARRSAPRAAERSVPRPPLRALGLPGARRGRLPAGPGGSTCLSTRPPGEPPPRSPTAPGAARGGPAACACGLGGRLPRAGRGRLERPDSSTTRGRSLVSCLHVVLSETGRGGGPRSLSAPTTTPASPVGERPGGRRLDGGGARGVASPGPRPPPPPPAAFLRGRQLPLRPEREPTAGGRAGERARLHPERRRGCWAPHPVSSSPRAPSDMVAPGSVTSRLGSVFPFLLVLVDLQYEDGDPDNYIAYYRRATVFLAMGKSKAALPDLTKVIELKMDFTAARLQRGHLLLKQGKLDEAEDDFKKVLKSNPSENEEKEAQSQIVKSDEMQRLRSQALDAFESSDYTAAITFLDKILEVCVWDAELRELRAECFIKEGEPRKAISDLKAASKLKNDNTEAFYKISTLYYQLGDHELSLSEVRECLKLDQDHKRCFAHYKQVKKLNKLIESAEELIRDGRYTDATSKYESVMKTEPTVSEYTIRSKERICHCFSKDEKPVEAIRICSEVLQMEPDNVNALKDRAEAYLIEEMYDEAIQDYETAQEHNENDQQIREGLEKAQRLLKQSQKRDYYKILGVKRNAKKQEIIKAYRKLALQWHPDNFQNEEEKKKAEKKFIDIAAAKEVLSDPEMRKKFDDGEDPLDAESQQGGGGNPFHRSWNSWQGFNPFSSGGPFRFKFHFN